MAEEQAFDETAARAVFASIGTAITASLAVIVRVLSEAGAVDAKRISELAGVVATAFEKGDPAVGLPREVLKALEATAEKLAPAGMAAAAAREFERKVLEGHLSQQADRIKYLENRMTFLERQSASGTVN